jgi:pimeloyl-ACP methyl ester carboxylesterase
MVSEVDRRRWGAGGSAPILVLQATENRVAARRGYRLQEKFPHRVRLLEIPGAGHAILPEQPRLVSAAVVAYLAALD